jgi:KipI family sensor histidine kinase inhibitor
LSPAARLRPVGDAAITLELGEDLSAETAARVQALDRAVARDPPPGFVEAVPTCRSLLVLFDPGRASRAEVEAALERHAREMPPTAPEAGRLRRVPVRYGGEDGPDLEEVARARGLSPRELAALHSGREYTALMLGFMPGFAYLGLLPEALATPRRATPRLRVPAGSVGVAGRQTGVYPWASPGGWSLLGRTSIRLFDPRADPPSLILPGDRVVFEPVEELPAAEPPAAPPAAARQPALEVLDGGLLTTVQDQGRVGYRRLGVSGAGAVDRPALHRANVLLGNAPGAAALECTVAGPTLLFLRPARFVVSGADLGAVLERADLGPWPVPRDVPVRARAGNVLAFTGARRGCRAYVALTGGIAVDPVLGSRSTDLSAGFGGLEGRALRRGDRLELGAPPAEPPAQPQPAEPEPADEVTVRVVPGPQADHLTDAARERLFGERWTVGPASDRVGCRLQGPLLEHAGPAEIVSDGMVPGAIQVPPDGQPIVMLADGPTTGGYPKPATVIASDLPLLAQLVPGRGRIRFQVLADGAAGS